MEASEHSILKIKPGRKKNAGTKQEIRVGIYGEKREHWRYETRADILPRFSEGAPSSAPSLRLGLDNRNCK